MERHFVQTKAWEEFKTAYSTRAVNAGGVLYTVHEIPFSGFNVAYAPKVNPDAIDFEVLKQSLIENKCSHINFDVPNVYARNQNEAPEIFKKYECIRSSRNTFAKSNVILDIPNSEEELLLKMHPKHRYNIGLGIKKGLIIKQDNFDDFYKLYEDTAKRQKYYIHPRKYYETLWAVLGPSGSKHASILTAYYNDIPLASWMLFISDNILYYPYGGSSLEHKNLQASTFLGFEVIKFGKQKDCSVFDMWGAAVDPNDKKDEYYGFTQFKLRFGGRHVTYMDSYDFVVNPVVYRLFVFVNQTRWKILELIK